MLPSRLLCGASGVSHSSASPVLQTLTTPQTASYLSKQPSNYATSLAALKEKRAIWGQLTLDMLAKPPHHVPAGVSDEVAKVCAHSCTPCCELLSTERPVSTPIVVCPCVSVAHRPGRPARTSKSRCGYEPSRWRSEIRTTLTTPSFWSACGWCTASACHAFATIPTSGAALGTALGGAQLAAAAAA